MVSSNNKHHHPTNSYKNHNNNKNNSCSNNKKMKNHPNKQTEQRNSKLVAAVRGRYWVNPIRKRDRNLDRLISQLLKAKIKSKRPQQQQQPNLHQVLLIPRKKKVSLKIHLPNSTCYEVKEKHNLHKIIMTLFMTSQTRGKVRDPRGRLNSIKRKQKIRKLKMMQIKSLLVLKNLRI